VFEAVRLNYLLAGKEQGQPTLKGLSNKHLIKWCQIWLSQNPRKATDHLASKLA